MSPMIFHIRLTTPTKIIRLCRHLQIRFMSTLKAFAATIVLCMFFEVVIEQTHGATLNDLLFYNPILC
jgi:hypothetical protein